MDVLVADSGRKTPARLAGSAVLACQSDTRLVQLVRDGHERAFEAIVNRYRRPLVRYCARILPESRTEDAVQQAFINAHVALLASDEPVQLKAWLYTITRNAALNMLRQNGWNYEQIPADFDGVLRPDQAFEQKIQVQQAVAAVNDLPGRQRDAIVMREFEGRSYEEIALALGTGDGAVRQLLNRARGTLRAAASAVLPPPLVARAATSLPPTDGRRVAEVLGSLGAAGIVKVGATAVVAGSLVVGAVSAPLGDHHSVNRPTAAKASASAHERTISNRPASPTRQGSSHFPAAGTQHAAGNPAGTRGKSQPRHAAGGPAVHHEHAVAEPGDDRSGPSSGDHHSGSNSGGETRSGSDDHRSGSNSGSSDGSTDSHSGSGDSTSGSSGSGSDDSTSSGSGSGSGDATTTFSGTDGSTSSGSGSTSGGSDDSISGSSVSGTSGSDSSGTSGTSGTSTSGSDSLTSGSSDH